jgi:superfamily II DNA/RNA helicase
MTTMNSEIETTNESNVEVLGEITNWDELGLSNDILRGIYAHGFEMPSPIQKKAIKPLIERKDIIAQAQSGTGKTATFTIGALSNIDLSSNTTQVLVLSPTKELTIQTGAVFKAISQFMTGLRIQLAYGGSVIEEGSSFSSRNVPHIICGCPGRVHDMMRRDKISSKKIKLVILDEADEMLSAGFKDQMYNIFQNFGPDIQVALFSATLPDSLQGIIDKIMRNPVRISVKREMLTLEGIKQYVVAVDDDRQKYATLKDLYKYITASQTIIYCNSIKRVQDLYEAMREDEFPVCRIHGNMDKKEREATFNEFRNGSSRVLISSNVTARGIDIQQVNIVINFDVPKDVHTYLHRIGRSGRWGRKGMGLNFVTRRDMQKLREIENHYKTQMMELPENLEGCFLR